MILTNIKSVITSKLFFMTNIYSAISTVLVYLIHVVRVYQHIIALLQLFLENSLEEYVLPNELCAHKIDSITSSDFLAINSTCTLL